MFSFCNYYLNKNEEEECHTLFAGCELLEVINPETNKDLVKFPFLSSPHLHGKTLAMVVRTQFASTKGQIIRGIIHKKDTSTKESKKWRYYQIALIVSSVLFCFSMSVYGKFQLYPYLELDF